MNKLTVGFNGFHHIDEEKVVILNYPDAIKFHRESLAPEIQIGDPDIDNSDVQDIIYMGKRTLALVDENFRGLSKPIEDSPGDDADIDESAMPDGSFDAIIIKFDENRRPRPNENGSTSP